MEKYERVLELMKAKGGRIDVDDPDLRTLLGADKPEGAGNVHYRLTTYMSFIRRFAHLNVTGIRETLTDATGKEKKTKKVIAYQLDAMQPSTPTADTPAV